MDPAGGAMWHCQMTTCIDVAVTPYATVTADAFPARQGRKNQVEGLVLGHPLRLRSSSALWHPKGGCALQFMITPWEILLGHSDSSSSSHPRFES